MYRQAFQILQLDRPKAYIWQLAKDPAITTHILKIRRALAPGSQDGPASRQAWAKAIRWSPGSGAVRGKDQVVRLTAEAATPLESAL
jgi:hypothetical protein